MKILVVGTGYVGLVTGACFAEMGHQVICLDIDQKKILKLKEGIIPIFEPGLEELVKRNVEEGRLEFSTDYAYGVAHALFCFIAVPTPADEDGSADLTYLKKAASQIAEQMDGYKIIINKSTVPVGSAQVVKTVIAQELEARGISYEFDVVSNPEFLKEGDAIVDFMKPDRIVIGTENPRVEALMEELYAPFNLNHDRILFMDPCSAEMTKYAANSMLAARISFMNEVAQICEQVGADVRLVRKGMGSDSRIGHAFLYAGMGYGGSCFPKDIKALRATGRENQCATPLLDAVDAVNYTQKERLGDKITAYFSKKGGLEGKTVAIWGLSFKPGTDDMREAPALVLIRQLLEEGAFVRLYDPVAMPNARQLLKKSPQITFCRNPFETCKGAHAIALVTEWKQFRFIDFNKALPLLEEKAFFDGRNQYTAKSMEALGFDYFSIGQPEKKLQLVLS
ncbi:MAG: UDP-glucose 6-dehydrogenase TuaD [Chlamydiales bacterium]|nr:UDP-glucose 6-dehydrogenase TuaD [Chlamydiales bacterium]